MVSMGINTVEGFRTVRKGWRFFLGGLGRWFSGVLGADKYQRYVEYYRAQGDHTVPMMSEREFWRHWQDYQQDNPQGRCC